MKVHTISCRCGAHSTISAYTATDVLKQIGQYSYGDHVQDSLAIVRRYMTMLGWRYLGGKVTRMRCPECKGKRPPEPDTSSV